MVTSHPERAPTFGEEIDLLLIELFKAKAPYEERKRGLLALEKQWMRKAKTPAQSLAVQRIVAKTILTEAFGFDMPWKEFGRWLRRLQRLGFQELGTRVHVACLYVQSLHRFPGRPARPGRCWRTWSGERSDFVAIVPSDRNIWSRSSTRGTPPGCPHRREEVPAWASPALRAAAWARLLEVTPAK
ncbi:hypothetical protein ACN28S_42065 [Cystobacter fuscus]